MQGLPAGSAESSDGPPGAFSPLPAEPGMSHASRASVFQVQSFVRPIENIDKKTTDPPPKIVKKTLYFSVVVW